MNAITIIVACAGGVLGIVSYLYVAYRIAFRVNEMWDERAAKQEEDQDMHDRVLLLEERMRGIQTHLLHRSTAEVRVRNAVRDRDSSRS